MTDVSKYPPGPWTVEQPDAPQRGRWIQEANGEYIAMACIHKSNSEEATARLIAAAPDMLAELKWLYEKHGYQSTADVIAKAESLSP